MFWYCRRVSGPPAMETSQPTSSIWSQPSVCSVYPYISWSINNTLMNPCICLNKHVLCLGLLDRYTVMSGGPEKILEHLLDTMRLDIHFSDPGTAPSYSSLNKINQTNPTLCERNNSPKNVNLLRIYSGRPRCGVDVCFPIRTLALHHLLCNGSSAVNGCRQNESPNR